MVKTIAPLSAYEWGQPVYRARVMLSKIDTTFYSDENCGFFSPRAKLDETSDSLEISFKVYPSPAKDQITLEYYSQIDADLHFEVFDLLGNKTYSLKLPGGSNNLSVNVGQLNSAIYFYKFYKNSDVVASGKLVLFR